MQPADALRAVGRLELVGAGLRLGVIVRREVERADGAAIVVRHVHRVRKLAGARIRCRLHALVRIDVADALRALGAGPPAAGVLARRQQAAVGVTGRKVARRNTRAPGAGSVSEGAANLAGAAARETGAVDAGRITDAWIDTLARTADLPICHAGLRARAWRAIPRVRAGGVIAADSPGVVAGHHEEGAGHHQVTEREPRQ